MRRAAKTLGSAVFELKIQIEGFKIRIGKYRFFKSKIVACNTCLLSFKAHLIKSSLKAHKIEDSLLR